MKKLTALTLTILFIFTLTACGNVKIREKNAIYSFSGGNDYFNVSNGIIVIAEDEETFSGGDLAITRKDAFSDVVSLRTEFYILRDGEEKTILVSELHDKTGGASVSLSGDLGKISGDTVVTEGRQSEEVEIDLLNNLYFRLTIKRNDGSSNTYTVQMDVEET